MGRGLKRTTESVIVFVALLSLGLLTREPAKSFDIYALHAILAAPFYAFVCAVTLKYLKSVVPFVCGASLYGIVLGSLQMVMGISVLIPLAFSVAGYFLARYLMQEKRILMTSLVFSGLVYPVTVLAGVLTGSYFIAWSSFSTVLQLVLFALLATALGLMGALVGLSIVRRISVKTETVEKEARSQ